jgi:hypothetical protein
VFGPLREIPVPTVVLSYDDAPAEPTGLMDPPPAPPAAAATAPVATPAAATPTPPAPAKDAAPPPSDVATPPAPPPAPPIVDANAPRIDLTQEAMSDARAAGGVTVTSTLTNAGKRPLIGAFHARMLEHRVLAPDGRKTRCDAAAPTRAIARDLFKTMKPGATQAFTVRLLEVCPLGTFARPGLYRVQSILRAREPGTEVGVDAWTGVAVGAAPTTVRVQSGPLPFYTAAPVPASTPVDAPAAATASD